MRKKYRKWQRFRKEVSMSQSTVLLLSCEVSVGVLEELRAFGGGEKGIVYIFYYFLRSLWSTA